ncbi:putative DNA binding domain-containing protein [Ruminococcaceae bacterium OttesenSCG-928-D13]|nr:putative DNA binding domain-containing protein [Ruminococcaceae bacterium OttesenSCG-928-D13]
MPSVINDAYVTLVNNLLRNDYEKPWVEFKANLSDPQQIGEYISSLSNSATLHGHEHGYLVWGIENNTHHVIGSRFDINTEKVGNQGLILWLETQLNPKVFFEFSAIDHPGGRIALLEIDGALREPVKFRGEEYIRVGEHKKKLRDCPELERKLWNIFSLISFEQHLAMEQVAGEDVLKKIDYPKYFELLNIDIPMGALGILDALVEDKLVQRNDFGTYDITNLGAVLFAKKLSDFSTLERKAVRVIQYKGDNRHRTIKEQIGGKGYASGFEGLIEYINTLVPQNEIINDALRTQVPMYPPLSIRELVANSLIHQDFAMRGTGPMVEIFENRMEITNPGAPLIHVDRFIDHPPISRNEQLASFMRRLGICEERGSGFDKVILETELYQLPAPEIDLLENHTRICLFAHRSFAEMDKDEKVRACYMHACLKRVNREYLTNSSLRERFKVDEKSISTVSRIIRDTVEYGLVKPVDENAAPKVMRYVPYWA